ncbi:MAG: NAD-dependent deacylase [Bacteroidia bacterium]|nr:NAD-dependent deacylase [Bacteroidia bacterium]
MSGQKRITVFTGSGISAESGIKTFRDSDGLWENYRVQDVATPEAFASNPKLVLDFYNQRRKQVLEAKPNEAHKALVRLEEKFDVRIVTQNVDDLHERAGSKHVLHLHGELGKARSVKNSEKVYDITGAEINLGDLAEDGGQLRPHIVWFGEDVPMMEAAITLVQECKTFLIIGTSLEVYPAASLLHFTYPNCSKILIDPKADSIIQRGDIRLVSETAGQGVPRIVDELLANEH